jgi:hypothetical protein
MCVFVTVNKTQELFCRQTVWQMDICMTWKLTMTKTNATVTWQGWSQILYGMEICPLMTYVTIYMLGKYSDVVLWEQECHRIFVETNSNWNRVTFRQAWRVIWLKCMKENSRARCYITCLERAIDYTVSYSFGMWYSFFVITYATPQRGSIFSSTKIWQSHKLMDILKCSRRLNFILRVHTQSQTIGTLGH